MKAEGVASWIQRDHHVQHLSVGQQAQPMGAYTLSPLLSLSYCGPPVLTSHIYKTTEGQHFYSAKSSIKTNQIVLGVFISYHHAGCYPSRNQ